MEMSKKSVVWLYFKVAEDSKYALCKQCDTNISHGSKTTKNFNTTNLMAHLKVNTRMSTKSTKQNAPISNWNICVLDLKI